MSKELAGALEVLEKEKGISKDIVIEALEDALVAAYKRNYGTSQNVEVNFNDASGDITVYQVKEVVEEAEYTNSQIALVDAREINRAYEVGDKIKFEVTPKSFGRIAAQTAKQVVLQRMREAERSIIYNEYIEYQDDLMTGTVERQDNRFIYVDLGKVEAVLSKRDQIEDETYNSHDRIKVYVSKVEDSTKGPQVFVSRTHPNLIKRLFEQEVPEIYDGTVEIVSIAREAGDRSKLAVTSHDSEVDAVGTCVGAKGARVQVVVDELNGENMDIVEWDKDPRIFIENALNPAQVLAVQFSSDDHSCRVVVPDYQLSLAIGKKGQNVRLAAKLTGYKIDILPESQVNLEDGSFEDGGTYQVEEEVEPSEAEPSVEETGLERGQEAEPGAEPVADSLNQESQELGDQAENPTNLEGLDELEDGQASVGEEEDLDLGSAELSQDDESTLDVNEASDLDLDE